MISYIGDYKKLPTESLTYLTLFQTANFKLSQTERVCRRQFQVCSKWQKYLQTGRKHCGKRKSLLSPQRFQKTSTADT